MLLQRAAEFHGTPVGRLKTIRATGSYVDLTGRGSTARSFSVTSAGGTRLRWEREEVGSREPVVTVLNGRYAWRESERGRLYLPLSRKSGIGLELLPVFGLARWVTETTQRVDRLSDEQLLDRVFDRVQVARSRRDVNDRQRTAAEKATRAVLYFDQQTGRLERLRYFRHVVDDWRVDVPVDLYLADFRLVEDVLWPFEVTVVQSGQSLARYVFETVVLNPEVSLDAFN